MSSPQVRLRAGLPLHHGALRMLDRADNAFISAYRHHTKGNKFIVKWNTCLAPWRMAAPIPADPTSPRPKPGAGLTRALPQHAWHARTGWVGRGARSRRRRLQ
ncbi:MAG: hypothetical protein R3B47_20660 [Bacteroidia bacterium]